MCVFWQRLVQLLMFQWLVSLLKSDFQARQRVCQGIAHIFSALYYKGRSTQEEHYALAFRSVGCDQNYWHLKPVDLHLNI